MGHIASMEAARYVSLSWVRWRVEITWEI